MCKAPDPPKPQAPEKPEFLHNRYLDAAIGQSATVAALRTGRAGLRIPIGSGLQVQSTDNAPPPPGRPATPVPNLGGNQNRRNSRGIGPRQTQVQ